MQLEQFIQRQRQRKDILLMSHVVLGYPSWEDNQNAIAALVRAGVELIELQFPFSEPIADGPILMTANHAAIKIGVSVQDCLDFTARITHQYPQTRFVIMTYVNILFKYGINNFAKTAAHNGVAGCIVPDLPIEQADDYRKACIKYNLATIFLVTPESSQQRIEQIVHHTSGLIYCVARKGVTGTHTQLSDQSHHYLTKVRCTTSLPMAVGFGIQSTTDLSNLIGYADVAVVGSQAVKQYVNHGANGLENLVRSFRSD